MEITRLNVINAFHGGNFFHFLFIVLSKFYDLDNGLRANENILTVEMDYAGRNNFMCRRKNLAECNVEELWWVLWCFLYSKQVAGIKLVFRMCEFVNKKYFK